MSRYQRQLSTNDSRPLSQAVHEGGSASTVCNRSETQWKCDSRQVLFGGLNPRINDDNPGRRGWYAAIAELEDGTDKELIAYASKRWSGE
jgi:hypothetical protein